MDEQTPLERLPALFRQLYDLPSSEVRQSSHFRAIRSDYHDKTEILSSIPVPSRRSHRPLHLLHTLLTEIPGPWPAVPLIRCYSRLWKSLPEKIKSSPGGELSSLLSSTSRLVKRSYNSFSDFLGRTTDPALRSPQSGDSITHQGLHDFAKKFRLPNSVTTRKPVVAIALPNGPLLAATCVAVTTYYTSAPINPAAGPEQFRADVAQASAQFILTTAADYERLQLNDAWVKAANIKVLFVEWDGGDGIALTTPSGEVLLTPDESPAPNTADDVGLVLFTSGTSVFVMDSWGLDSKDICLNMMPLYHVGGLVRNIFAPIFSGGSTVCCNAFEASLFWDVVEDVQPTCCVVLPSYGMTECMPISTPPLDYRLDREGTSGISTGPELTILDQSEAEVPPGTVGRICVRGEPVFPGYLLPDGSFDKRPFNADGWFDTGDLGFMDTDGYLYITGRSKEVINRGGELISPFEVENAIMTATMTDTPIRGRVSQALAFSASHSVLQEVVAVALVTPANTPRVDLKALHSALRSSLQQAKWPVLIAYMDDLPKRNNKVLRIKLAQRLGLPEMEDDMPYLRRHWQASCPPADSALSVPIQSSPCSIDYVLVSQALSSIVPSNLRFHCHKYPTDDVFDVILAPAKTTSPKPQPRAATELQKQLCASLHNYMSPQQFHVLPDPMPADKHGDVDETELRQTLDSLLGATLHKLDETTDGRVVKVFADVLSRHPTDIPADVDFFSLGGDSLRAGRLLSALRSTFNVQLPISIVFNQGTVQAISAYIDKVAAAGPNDYCDGRIVGCTTTNSSTNPLLMALQLLPLVVVYPLRRAFQWTLFVLALSYTQNWSTHASVPGRFVNVLLSITLARLIVRCIAPFAGIAAKWIIIGRYREGLYPMWGWYHSRWWMVQKIESICGMGLFGVSESTTRIYCRLMGARVGKNVKLAGAALGEWDLLDIRDGAVLTRCICRPFAAEGNTTMYLGKIVVGENSSVGISSIVAAGSRIPPNTCIGPNSSSWEMEDAEEANRGLSLVGHAKPHWLLTLLLTMPLALVAWVLALLPWAGGLMGMVLKQPHDHDTPLRDVLDWFAAAERVAYHYLALILRTFFAPFIMFAFTVLVKVVLDVLFGELGPSSSMSHSAIAAWRVDLIRRLMPVRKLHELTALFGQHYEATSVAFRMLGSKIGRRVYWPGTGPSVGDYHLLDVGNDVVFGSRAHLVTSDGTGSERITIGDHAMIADRVCLLPGVIIGEEATMGSGSLTRRGKSYDAGGTFVGSKGGDAVCLTTGRDRLNEKHRRTCFNPMGSDVTLTGDGPMPPKEPMRARIQHMSSDDTLTETRKYSRQARREKNPDPYSSSDSDSDDNEDPPVSETGSPFGRAFYMKLAPYRVLGPFSIFCYSTFMAVFTAFYWNVSSVSSIQVVDAMMNHLVDRRNNIGAQAFFLFCLCSLAMAILTTIQAVLALAIVIAAKWALLGRRQPGNYDWDKSSYCQRWQLFLSIERLRRQCFRGQGVLGLLTGTSWIVFYFRALGAKIGKDCAIFANGCPSLMFTEPDLITLGDRVVVDDASVVAHINTRGKFDLNRLEIGSRCVLRTGSRLLSGAMMKDDSCLLEHTLIMGGDVVEERWTMQGWPAERFGGQRVDMDADVKTPGRYSV
ncbi:AMP-binding enzyme [Hirsutella rhossiliensis]|uniref:AMP-binding enzyme domain-containing protein n=1 Tax=Hirsutella rhossiliensis TaxID=111463 RepID=A0A9P8MSN3_9HYPO|nr:AMP-binding enzyme domain-containing protein [Hirsutella rhossiliensis]KAH0960337.1 AMP-binding enzyme domain-containing protein [Hirsutella rhossiliensis]